MHWNDIEDIALKLEETYDQEEIPEYDLNYLEEMVRSLPDFEDQEVEADAEYSKNILEHWLALRNN